MFVNALFAFAVPADGYNSICTRGTQLSNVNTHVATVSAPNSHASSVTPVCLFLFVCVRCSSLRFVILNLPLMQLFWYKSQIDFCFCNDFWCMCGSWPFILKVDVWNSVLWFQDGRVVRYWRGNESEHVIKFSLEPLLLTCVYFLCALYSFLIFRVSEKFITRIPLNILLLDLFLHASCFVMCAHTCFLFG